MQEIVEYIFSYFISQYDLYTTAAYSHCNHATSQPI